MKRFLLYILIFFTPFIPRLFAFDISLCEDFNKKLVGNIHLSGLVITKPHIVYRELLHKKDQPFSCSKWRQELKKLENLDIFSSVQLVIGTDSALLVLNYQFKELPRIIPFLGGKKTDQDGLIIGPALASLNFLGRDIRLEAYARSSVESLDGAKEFQAVASSHWLGSWPIDSWFQYILTDNYNPYENFPEQSHLVLITLKQRVSQSWNLKYSTEFFSIHTDTISANEILVSIGQMDHDLRFGFGIIKDTRESLFNPHKGIYGELMYTQTVGDAQFAEFLGDFRWFIPLAKKHILHLSGLARYRLGQVGAYDRFHAGGSNTLRAYDPIIDNIAGSNEILIFTEYRYEWIRKKDVKILGYAWYYGIQLVAGADMAYLWDRNYFEEGGEGRSIYIGTHFLFPGLDRVRFEVGNKATKFKIDAKFSFGLWERSTSQRWRIR